MHQSPLHRYHRQMLLPSIGEEGQRRLLAAHVLVVGCGALGTVIADTLSRAGVGTLSLVDRDVVEVTNLQRQVLFDEEDVAEGTPKAIAAARKIARVNSRIEVRASVEDFNHTNAERMARGVDVLLDGLDNFQGRYLLNDLSVRLGIPYCYGGAVGTTGMACVFLPHSHHRADAAACRVAWSDNHATPCLRCVFPEAPPPGSTPTCDTAGVLASAAAMIAHHQVTQAIKLLTGNLDAVDRSLLSIDLWSNEWRRLDVSGARSAGDCPCCVRGCFDFLEGKSGSSATSLCGRGAVQINPRLAPARETGGSQTPGAIDLPALAARLRPHGEFHANEFLLRGTLRDERGDEEQPLELTVFADGRAIVSGTGRLELARSIYDKYIGA